jgi:RHS repeat-associated protein
MRRWRRLVWTAALTTTLMVTATTTVNAATMVATPSATRHAPAIPRDSQIPYTRLTPAPAPSLPPFRRYDPTAATKLPGAGSATVDLTTGATRAATSTALPGGAPMRRAGTLPVLLGPAPGAAGPARVTVTLTDQGTARAAGVHGVLFSVAPADAAAGAGPLTVSVDDSSFAAAYGGDYAARLHLVQLPACALTTPQLAACQAQTPLPAAGASPLTARVATSRTVLAATAGTDGSSGTYAATSLSPAGTWSAGGNTGSFSYSYPIQVPAAIGGGAPTVELSYDSSSQDGRTEGTNNQSSWIGDGWTSTESYVERTYQSCSDDSTTGAPQWSADQCWKGQVLTLSLNGRSTVIVQDDVTHRFRPASDSSTMAIEQLTTCPNGTYNSECWRVTENGVQYFFGLDQLPGWSSGKATTQSAWTVPVYCSPAAAACSSSSFAGSSKLMGWRWNLDYVVDLHGNAAAYYYQPETNSYGADMATKPVAYTRGGYLVRIDYGMTSSTVYSGTAPEQVVFNVGERCIRDSPAGNTCADSQYTVANAAFWPDVPVDQDCATLDASSCPNHGPSFWSRKRLASIVTQVQVNGATQKVDEYDLTQSFPDGGDHAPTLWLDSIQRTGLDTSAGGASPLANPPVSFDPPLQLPNRVGTLPSIPVMYHDRIQDVTTETGAQITVTYDPATCTTANVPSSPATNTMPCYPVYWTPYGATAPELDWFHKYTVQQVLTQDRHNTNPDGTYPELLTRYRYDNGAAWHYDDNETVKAVNRTYGQFRGYGAVETITGDAGVFHATNGANVFDQPVLVRTTYLRGMDSNTPAGTGGAAVTVASLDGRYSVRDANALAGRVFETDTYTDATGATLNGATVTVPTIIGPTASHARAGLPALTAQMVRIASTHARLAVSTSPGWRSTETDTFYTTAIDQPTTGMPVQVDDRGDTADPSNIALCTWTRYVENTGETLVLPAESITNAQDCGSAGATATGPLVSDTRTSYDGNAFTWDGASPSGAAPASGDATTTATASGPTGAVSATTFTTLTATTYDSYGRTATVTRTPSSTAPNGSSLARTVATTYTPAGGALPTSVRTRAQVTPGASVNPCIAPGCETTSATVDAARALPVTQTDPANHETDLSHDALGRLTEVWLPDQPRAAGAPATYLFSYAVSQTGPSVTTTSRLLENGTYAVSETLSDALLRTRQTQTVSENATISVSDTQYDSLGRTVLTNNAYTVTGAPGTALVSVAQGSVPDTTVTDYDGLGRASLVTEEHDGAATWATATAYAGDHTTVIPPAGGISQTTHTNARGQATELDQYTTAPTLTGSARSGYTVAGGTVIQTTYAYTPAGQQATVTGPDGSVWSSTHDLLGHRTGQSDPDTGHSGFAYDDAGNLVSSVDARGVQLDYTYDLLGRRLTATDRSGGGFLLATWLYDTLQVGKLTSSTRFVPGATGGYTVATTGYTPMGRPSGTTITLPSSEAPLPGTYTTTYAYSVNDELLTTQGDPRTLGIAGENITYGYDALGSPVSVKGASVVAGPVTYTSYGEPGQIALGPSGNQAWLTYTYDDQTRRLTDVLTSRTQSSGPAVNDTSYTYDASGNPTSVTDQHLETGSAVIDTQCYQYDALDRLSQAWTDTAGVNAAGVGATGGCRTASPSGGTLATGPAAYWQSYSYDVIGDRTGVTDHATNGAAGDTATTYVNGAAPPAGCANTAVQPHTLTRTSTTGPAGSTSTSFCYDRLGGTAARAPSTGTAQSLAWDDEGRLASVTQGASTTSYLYDADGNQLIRRDPGQTTLFAGDTEIVVNTAASPHVLLGAVRTYTLGGTAIAVGSSLPGGGLDYVLNDPHGTATMAMDTTTQAVSRRQYTPYGQVRGTTAAAWPDPTRGFLARPQDLTTGYADVGARKYDPTLGRFISRDPLLETNDSQQLGGYTYAADNPVTRSDPSGLRACPDGDCSTGRVQAPQQPSPSYYGPPLSVQRGSAGTYVVDQAGMPHVLRTGPDTSDPEAMKMHDYLTGFLKQSNGYCDGSNGCTGYEYLWQDDKATKSMVTSSKYDPAPKGTTSDFIKLTFVNGEMRNVSSVDVYSPDPGSTKSTINREIAQKLNKQADQVVVYLKSPDQRSLVSQRFLNPQRRVVILGQTPDETYDSNAGLERLSLALLQWQAQIERGPSAPAPAPTPTPSPQGTGGACMASTAGCGPPNPVPSFNFVL